MQEARRDVDRSHKAPFGVSGGIFTADQIASAQSYAEQALAARDIAVPAAEQAVLAASSAQSELESRSYAIANYHPVSAPTKIRVAGYSSAGDGGSALYKKVLSEPTHTGKLAVTLADGVTIVWYEIAETVVNPQMFGAVGDGATDDTQAVRNALAFSGSVELQSFYKLTSTVTVTGKAVSISCPKGKSYGGFIADVSAGNVLEIKPTTGNHFFELRDFSMKCARPPVAGQRAIWIDGSSQVTNVPYNDKFLTGEREKRRGVIENIDFTTDNASLNAFAHGLRITSLLNFSMSGIMFYGLAGTFNGEAYAIDGDGVPVDIRARNLYAYNVAIGFNMPDYVEAVYLTETEFVNVNEGIVCGRYQSGRSVLASTACGSSGMRVGPGHAAARVAGIDMRKSNFCSISRNMIVLLPYSTTNVYGINVQDSNFVDVLNNMINNTNTLATNKYGIVLNGVTNSDVNGNKAQSATYGIVLVNSDGNNFEGNKSYSGGAYCISIDSNSTENVFFPSNRGGTTRVYELNSTLNIFVPRMYNKRQVAVLAGGAASENINITVPAGIFTRAPETASMRSSGGATLYGEYDPANSSATNLRFIGRLTGGGSIGGGSYTLVVTAEEPLP